jgi:ribosome-associated toxin RatA of RatAB toxin-antitoxin module
MVEIKQCRLYLIILLSLCCLSAYAQEQQKPVVSVARQDSHFQVSASIVMPVTPCVAYALLTDYASLPDYIPGVLEIHAERISQSTIKVHQVGEVEVLFFHIKMETSLEMEEIPNQRIIFKQTEGDLESYSGDWNLLETSEGTLLVFKASLVFKHFMPFFLARPVFEKEIGKRFEAIAKEALSRKSKSLSACGAGQ